MLKNSSLPIAAALCICAALAFAQEVPSAEKKADESKPGPTVITGKTTPRPKPRLAPARTIEEAPVPEIISTPKPKKPGFFQRIFGPRKPKVEATPAPETADTSKKPQPGKPATTAKTDKKPKAGATPKPDLPVLASPPAKTVTKTPAKPVSAADAETKKPAVEPPADVDPEVQQRARFDAAKAKASEDPQVKSLKAKADNAATDDESRKALRAYNKALFEKIRKVDSSVAERATLLEAAILKRLNE